MTLTDKQPVALAAAFSALAKAVVTILVLLNVLDAKLGAEIIGGETAVSAILAWLVHNKVTSPATLAANYIPKVQIPEAALPSSPPPQDPSSVMKLPTQP